MAYVKPEEIVENMLKTATNKASLSIKDLLIRGALSGAFMGLLHAILSVTIAALI